MEQIKTNRTVAEEKAKNDAKPLTVTPLKLKDRPEMQRPERKAQQ